MKKEVSISNKTIHVLSLILFFIPTFISFLLKFIISSNIYISIDYLKILLLIAIPILHELIHLMGFLIFAQLKVNELIFKPNKSSPLPYFRTNLSLSRDDYILILLLPCILLACSSIILSLLFFDIFYLFLMGYSISIAAGDLLLIKELFKLDSETEIIPLTDALGLTIVYNSQKFYKKI